MSGQGRGRGEPAPSDQPAEPPRAKAPRSSALDESSTSSSSEGNGDNGEKTIRGRGGFKTKELNTIPPGVKVTQGKPKDTDLPVNMYANFVKITAMASRDFHQYRVDFEPDIESVPMRKRLFLQVTESIFERKVIFDGMHDARSGKKVESKESTFSAVHPADNTPVRITMKRVGIVAGSFELTRIYNMHMKRFLDAMGFVRVSTTGAYVHQDMVNKIGQHDNLVAALGFRTAANVHEGGQILMNLEAVHKIMQRQTVLAYMMTFRQSNRPTFKEDIRRAMSGKLVITKYNKLVYRVEDVNFDLSPSNTFEDRKTGRSISYVEYYRTRYNENITDVRQPLLLVVQNNNRRQAERQAGDGPQHDIYLVPELCKIAGLTDAQRDDNRMKMDLIKASQIAPDIRVNHLLDFLRSMHNNTAVADMLQSWGYTYENEPIKIKGRCLATETIGMGQKAHGPPALWAKVDPTGSFDRDIQRECLAKAPPLPKLAIIISKVDAGNENNISGKLRQGFSKIGLIPANVEFHRMVEGDQAHTYVQYIKKLPVDITAAIVILNRQNKERYDAVKKIASVERGLITQVVTARLMTDDRKAGGAAIKIGVQVAAKLGGEPWYINLPLAGAMVCGYDTYHDTAHRGRSYGAFIASMNNRFSRWYSKADSHDRLDELSSHMAENLSASLRRYRELNNKYPERVFIYRDGVSDGQLEHVYNTELRQIKESIAKCETSTTKIGLTVIVVNKRIGARFYMKTNTSFINPNPGTIVDDVVTRKERYDFYLISQSTRHGTVSPTYYNIIQDTSSLSADKHQAMAYKMCFLYYNWTGSVRVPAPCQYAHKLALLCGEHLHDIPNTNLDDKLHFL